MIDGLENAKEIHNILLDYIQIHNDIFSVRIFRNIDFNNYSKRLSAHINRLNEIIPILDKEKEFDNLLKKYTEALCDTISLLITICNKLHNKSQGKTGLYNWWQYRKDYSIYLKSVKIYKAIGNQVNSYINNSNFSQYNLEHTNEQNILITSDEIIKLLVTNVANMKANKFLIECKNKGMRQTPFKNLDLDGNLPPFDIGYHLKFNPDGKEEALFEILQKDGYVLQAGYQFITFNA